MLVENSKGEKLITVKHKAKEIMKSLVCHDEEFGIRV